MQVVLQTDSTEDDYRDTVKLSVKGKKLQSCRSKIIQWPYI